MTINKLHRTTPLLLGLILFFYSPVSLKSQTDGARYFKVGDTIPDLQFRIHNYKYKTASTSDFKGKLVILDLWDIHCSTCIGRMPGMEALQQKFSDKIQILLVTKDAPEKVYKRAIHSNIIKRNKLPSIMGDDSIAFRFNVSVLPTHVWIDTSGVIKFITNGWDPDEEKAIEDYLAGKPVNLKEKIDVAIDNDKPLLLTWYPYQKEIGLYSYLAPFPKDEKIAIRGGVSILKNKNGAIYRVRLDRRPLFSIYKVAYGFGNLPVADNRIIINGTWSKKNKLTDFNWTSGINLFNYEIINSEADNSEQTLGMIRQQVDSYINARSSMEERPVFCYILRRNDSLKRYLASGGPVKVDKDSGGNYNAENLPWSNFIRRFGWPTYTQLQLIDETGINPKTKVTIACNLNNWKDIKSLNMELSKYGLIVNKELRVLKCIIISPNESLISKR